MKKTGKYKYIVVAALVSLIMLASLWIPGIDTSQPNALVTPEASPVQTPSEPQVTPGPIETIGGDYVATLYTNHIRALVGFCGTNLYHLRLVETTPSSVTIEYGLVGGYDTQTFQIEDPNNPPHFMADCYMVYVEKDPNSNWLLRVYEK